MMKSLDGYGFTAKDLLISDPSKLLTVDIMEIYKAIKDQIRISHKEARYTVEYKLPTTFSTEIFESLQDTQLVVYTELIQKLSAEGFKVYINLPGESENAEVTLIVQWPSALSDKEKVRRVSLLKSHMLVINKK